MGPIRQNWTFPYKATFLVDHLKTIEKEIAKEIDEKLDEEALDERDLAEFREKMRLAGVQGWENIQRPNTSGSMTRGTKARSYYTTLAKRLSEIVTYRQAMERDLERDPDRAFKLSYDDLMFFDL
jgi:flagellar biosynthesis chaperone FliJ